MKEIVLETMEDFYDDDCQMVIRELIKSGGARLKITKLKKGRTELQNNSLHKWLRGLAKKMNAAGLTHRTLWEKMRRGFDIPVSEENLKGIAQKVCVDQFGKEKTSELTTIEMCDLYEILNLAFGQAVGVCEEWPSNDSKIEEGLLNER